MEISKRFFYPIAQLITVLIVITATLATYYTNIHGVTLGFVDKDFTRLRQQIKIGFILDFDNLDTFFVIYQIFKLASSILPDFGLFSLNQ